ncbi:MAG: succinate dehydrogenase cytochrome b subunit [Myxococcales bacterium]|nr:succinate dehydrogenase cytochrome b subunit [Myxococcales bacterium]
MSTASGGNAIGRLLGSTIGMKILMAITGFIWIGFVLGHMVGNLQILLPMPEDGIHAINKYAAMLKATGGLLWAVRFGLLAAFAAHVWAAIVLSKRNRAARADSYAVSNNIQAKPSSYYMLITGLVILGFIVFHLAHFTLGLVQPEAFGHHLANGMHDVYTMFILGFRNPVYAGLYIVANVLIGMHLHHAVTSMFQTLGLRTPKYQQYIDMAGPAVASVAIVGNVLMPVAVLLGLIGGSVS